LVKENSKDMKNGDKLLLIPCIGGKIPKSEILSMVFNHSKYFYRKAIVELSAKNTVFANEYPAYHRKKTLTQELATIIIDHTAHSFKFVGINNL
jgi:hypothetical protein